jgi:hypothetical protein
MIKKAFLAGLRGGSIAAEELYGLDDQELFVLLSCRDYPLSKLAGQVRDGQLFPATVEIPFNAALHGHLLDIENRYQYETALAAELSAMLGITINAEEIIIDVPEPISFETGLYVADESLDCMRRIQGWL